jgi:glycine/D-amino acid oxidase-like deaminating enzyme
MDWFPAFASRQPAGDRTVDGDAGHCVRFGHRHLGLTQAAAAASLIADLIARRRPEIDITAFRPNWF